MMLLKPAQPKPELALDPSGHCAACEIRELSVCSTLSRTELARLSAIILGRRVETGGTVISEGDPATDLFNVVRGSVKLYKLLPDGRRQVTGFLFPGDFLGIALNDIYAYTAEALEPLQLCRFPRKKLEDCRSSCRSSSAGCWARPPMSWPWPRIRCSSSAGRRPRSGSPPSWSRSRAAR